MRLAFKNLLARKMSTVKVLISMLVMVMIMCVFTSYIIALSDESNKVIGSYRAGHYLNVDTYSSISDQSLATIGDISGVGEVKAKGVYSHEDNFRDMSFEISGHDYECNHFIYDSDENAGSDSNMNMLHRGEIGFAESNVSVVSNNDILEHEYRWDDLDLIKAGTASVKGNEIIVSEYFINEFGLDSSVIGKTVNISLGKNTYSGITIVGVLSDQYYKLTGAHRQHIISSFDSELYSAVSGDVDYNTIVYIEDYMSVKAIGESVARLGYFKITAGSEYGMLMATTVTIIDNVLIGVMVTVGLSILGAIILNIVLSMRYMIVKKADFYGIISAYGTKNQGIFNILFFEMVYIAAIAGALAYALSYGIVYLLDYILTKMLGIGVLFSAANFLITLAVAFVFCLIVILIVTIVNYVAFTRKNTMKMLGRTLGT